ncbi:hypothetical protein ATHEMM101B_18930 [Atlantibacter hermannii]
MKSSILLVVDHENQGTYKMLWDLSNECWRGNYTLISGHKFFTR